MLIIGKFIYYKSDNKYRDSISYIISINDENASSQIESDIYSYVWVSENILAYSIQNVGVYLYNAIDFSTKQIVNGEEDFYIKGYKNGILKYDNEELSINY